MAELGWIRESPGWCETLTGGPKGVTIGIQKEGPSAFYAWFRHNDHIESIQLRPRPSIWAAKKDAEALAKICEKTQQKD